MLINIVVGTVLTAVLYTYYTKLIIFMYLYLDVTLTNFSTKHFLSMNSLRGLVARASRSHENKCTLRFYKSRYGRTSVHLLTSLLGTLLDEAGQNGTSILFNFCALTVNSSDSLLLNVKTSLNLQIRKYQLSLA